MFILTFEKSRFVELNARLEERSNHRWVAT